MSPGCTNCYAETLSHRNPKVLGEWGPKGVRVVASESAWREPLKWDRAAKATGERHRVFCASLADVFEDRPELVEPRTRLFELIWATPNLDWLLLTKRPETWRKVMRDTIDSIPRRGSGRTALRWNLLDWLQEGQPSGKPHPSNVWLGVSVEDQARADERIPLLLQIPAAARFLSVEPLLGPVSFDLSGIDWVIVGGESGHDARPMHPDWARSIRDQCVAVGVPFFFKQWGEWLPVSRPMDADEVVRARNTYPRGRWLEPDGAAVHRTWDCVMVDRVGKRAAGRLLDGRTWDEIPVVLAPNRPKTCCEQAKAKEVRKRKALEGEG